MNHLHTNTCKIANAQVLNTRIPFQGEGKKGISLSDVIDNLYFN